jgi:hypothetical protein
VNVIGLPPIPDDQALALINNKEAFGRGFWPDENRMIIPELVVVSGLGSTPRHDEITASGSTGWDVHVTMHIENMAFFITIIVITAAVFQTGYLAAILTGTAIEKISHKTPTPRKQTGRVNEQPEPETTITD